MTRTRKFAQALLSIIVILSMVLPLTQTQPVSAQEEGDDVRKLTNSGTGKVNFIGPLSGRQYVSPDALGIPKGAHAPTSAEAAMALAERFAPEFGIEHPKSDLTELRTNEQENGRVTVDYQQNYLGIPVIGGELVVNTDKNGDLYSMNGEVAQELALDTQPAISAEAAIETAKQGMAKWYGGTKDDYQPSESPSLWIYDEQLLRPSIRPAELVWRMEITPIQQAQPVRELILVSAKNGKLALHFNQIDTAWGDTQTQDPDPTVTPTPLPTEPPVSTEEPITTATPIPAGKTDLGEGSSSTLNSRVKTAFNGTTRYVALTGAASSGCTSSPNPCSNTQYAINSSANGDVIKVAEGTSSGKAPGQSNPNVVILNKGVLLSGGWQGGFSSQTGISIIDGEDTNNGILVTAAAATEVDQFIVQNSRTGSNSGAIYHAGVNLTLKNSTLNNNNAGRGAGIYVTSNAGLTLINSTISGNTANTSGGGIYVDSGTVNIEYSTIAYNTATSSGGGIYRNTGTLNIHNSILANNTNITAPNCNYLSASGYDIISSITGCTVPAGTGNQLDVDPQIEATLTGTSAVHALAAGSPAMDAGDLTSCTTNAGNRDQRGTIRPQGTGCDIGAFESENFEPGVPYRVVISSGNDQEKQVNQAFDAPLMVFVQDYFGTPISGANVTFTAPASGASGTFASTSNNTETVTTGATGIATSSTFTANNTVGTHTVIASTSGAASTASFSLENLPVPGVPASITSVSGSNQQAQFNQAFSNPFVALIKDGYGDPVSGVSVIFTAPASGASGTFASNSTRTETVFTDSSGNATSSIFTANGNAGSYTINATTSGVTAQATYQLQNQYIPGVPQTITVTGGNNQGTLPNSTFTNPFVVRVTDGYGTAVSGVEVTFTAPSSGASGVFTNSGTNIETITTNATGYATSSSFTANGISGTYTVNASVPGVVSSAYITVVNIGTRYVKPSAVGGVDTGDCFSAATACATINYAISQAFPS